MAIENPTRDADAAELTTVRQTYARLKELILALELPPGSTVREAELQQRLGVGRTPLREALHRLAHEGMLHIYPRRATVVAKLGMAEVRQIFEVRLALESASAALAAERATARDLEALSSINAELAELRERGEPVRFLQVDQRFHRTIARAAQNALLAEHLDHVLSLNLWLWRVELSVVGPHGATLFAHEPIVDAISRRDPTAAAAAMSDHVRSSKDQLLRRC